MNERDQEIYRGGYEAFRNLVLLRLKDARSWLGGPKRDAKFEDGFSCAATIAESMVRVPQLLFMQATTVADRNQRPKVGIFRHNV